MSRSYEPLPLRLSFAPHRHPPLIAALPVCQHRRRSGFGPAPPMLLAKVSQLLRVIASPWRAKPHDQLPLKYQPTPLASCVVLPVPVSNVTSERGACAATRRFAAPVLRQAMSRLA